MTAPLLTARDVAELVGVSPETVLRWTRAGELPAIRLPGGRLRYRRDMVDAWLEARATTGRGVLATTLDAARTGTVPSIGLATTEDEE